MAKRDWDILLRELNTEGKPVKHYMKGQPAKDNTVGWCSNNNHKGAVSLKMLKQHKCLDRGCKYFRKNEEHGYWKHKEEIKKNKKRRKQKQQSTSVQGTKAVKTGTNIKRSNSNFNKELSNISKYFENSQIYHVYTFEKSTNSLKYLGGLYSLEAAVAKIQECNNLYHVIATKENNIWGYYGYRTHETGIVKQIDLTWGGLYPNLLATVVKDIELKEKYKYL